MKPKRTTVLSVARERRQIASARLLGVVFAIAWFGLMANVSPGYSDTLSDEATAGHPVPLSSFKSIGVEPFEIALNGNNRRQQLQVTAVLEDGTSCDVTHRSLFTVSDLALARIEQAAVVGLAEGEGTVAVQCGTAQCGVKLRIRGFADYPPVHFTNDVMPVFSKLGCNSGACHGKASGQNGFKLSVFGFDPDADYKAIVEESRGRRVFPASATNSLLVAKPSGRLPHGGGQRLVVGSDDERLMVEWIRQGMPVGRSDAPTISSIQVTPTARVMRFGQEQQLLVTAIYSNGSQRDVTAATAYTSNASLVAEADTHGLIRVGKVPGQAAVTANYMGQVVAVEIQVPRPNAPTPYPQQPVHNAIDPLVWTKLEKMGLVPSEIVDDATFLRRASLDMIGVLPTPDEVRRFLADTAPEKRAAAVERLLARDEYADFWALKWSDILLVDRNRLAERGAYELHRWLREQFAANRPYDQWVCDLVTANGNTGSAGPANLYRALDTPDVAARTLSQAFLGVRVECAQCHHHPFEKWSQDDFYGLAGFFNGLERKPLSTDRVLVYHAGYRETRIPLSNRLVSTRPLDGPVPADIAQGDPRVKLAAWMTDAKNPWFARLACNRLWKHFFGRGLVEPEDDFRSTNPASNEPLLAFLSEQLTRERFDLKSVMRLIVNSRVYQLSSIANSTNVDDEQNFSHHYVRRLPAEVMLDAIADVTLAAEPYPGRPPGTRAIQLWDNRLPSYFLDIFGRPERTSPCECGRTSDPTMAQALHLMNAPEIEAKLADPRGRVAKLIASGANAETIVDELCLAALGRPPGDKERHLAENLFSHGTTRPAVEDFLWTLLNSYDFLFIQ